ncbi:MAG: vWA domain-containing protein [Limisphaerales bacterium]
MKTETFLDYDTILADHTQPVHFAIRFQAEAFTPSQSRLHPAAFCVVLDRSGSMAGAPLDHAKAAAVLAVRHLRAEDHFALVVFDDQARTVIPLQPATVRRKAGFLQAIADIQDGGSTNLTAGWMLGREELRTAPLGTPRRLLLLSDGQLNVGLVETSAVRQIVASGIEHDRVRTSCLGFGAHYHEDLLAELARATGGQFYDADSPEKFPAIFASELEGLQRISVQNLRLRLKAMDFCAGLTPLGDYPALTLPDGRIELALGDLVAAEERIVCFGLHVLPLPCLEGQPVFSVDGEPLVQIEVLYDEITSEGIGSSTYLQTVSVQRTQDPGQVRRNGEVIQWVALQKAGKAVAEATRQMDVRDAKAAQSTLDRALREVSGYGDGAGVTEAVRMLEDLRGRTEGEALTARERKEARYLSANLRKMSSADLWTLESPAPVFKKPRRTPAKSSGGDAKS